MATFERGSSEQADADSPQHTKFPLIRLEPSIQKFLKVIQIDLARLHRHRLNVEKYNRLQDWTDLHTEQINATRTIQQIKANIHEIEKCRLQVCSEDLEKFDRKINDMKHGAINSVQEFVDLLHGDRHTTVPNGSSPESSPLDEHQPLTFEQGQVHLTEPPENTQAVESWENLQENLEELNMMIHEFANLVNSQQESVDRIEDNIEQASSDVREGVRHLGKASRLKGFIFPVAGAVIGTAIGGPVGLFAGLKLGGLVGAVGGASGLIGGTFLKRRQAKVTEIELSKLSRTNSLPDVNADHAESNSWFSFSRKRNQSATEHGAPTVDITEQGTSH